MSVVSMAGAWPAAGRPFTVAELDRMPDDGRRYELLDGVLVVSPRPATIHQLVATRLAALLTGASRDEPELIVFELRDGRYLEVAHVTGDEAFVAGRPFRAEVIPSRLVAGLPAGGQA